MKPALQAFVDASWIGLRVWGFTGTDGGYVEQAVAPVEQILPLPSSLSAVAAVTLGSSGAMAHFGLRHAHFTPGETILVRGAACSIGIMAIQLAARGGAAAVADTTSSAERGERLRRLGATHALDRSGHAEKEAPAGYDVIIDVVAGEDMPSFFDRLNPNGRMVAVGAVAGQPPADFGTKIMAAFQQSMSFAALNAATVAQADLRAVRSEQLAAASRGEIETVVHEVLPLGQAVLAHQKPAAGEVFGRIVLTPWSKVSTPGLPRSPAQSRRESPMSVRDDGLGLPRDRALREDR
ncbi:zinc-binding dehydrogenase [Streptomyces sp. NPDC004270]